MRQRFAVILLALFLAPLLTAPSARAACFNPAGNAGDIEYNGADGVQQYCNGGAWVSMATIGNTTTGLAGWWKLDDGSGTSAADSSGNGNTGTLVNTPTWTTGMTGGALTFNGSNQYVDVPDSASVEVTSAFTISLWFQSSNTGQTNKYLVSRDGSSGGAIQWAVLYNYVSNQVEFWDDNPNGGTGADPRPGSQISVADTSWHQIVYAYDGTTWSGYKDGVQVFSVSRSFALLPMVGNHLYIGVADPSDPSTVVAGTIDDVRLYNRALSAADVMTLYTSTGGESGDINTGLKGYWKFDEGSGTTANDSSANGNTGTLVNSPTWTTSGQINDALTLNGTNQYVSIGNPASLQIAGDITLCAWAYPNNKQSFILAKTDGAGTYDYGLYISASNYLTLYYGSNLNTWSSPATVSLNAWHHLCAVVQSSNSTFYIDGMGQTGGAATITNNNKSLSIGRQGSSSNYYLNGSVDEVRIYNRALSASDVRTLYNMTATSCASPVGYTGDLIYNGANHVMQFCNGSSWIPAGPVPGAGGGGCASPAGVEHDIIFSSASHVMQYCDGANWSALGGIVPVGNGLVGWWNLDEGSGTSAADSSGNGNTGTLTNAPTWTTSGRFNGALVFANASDRYVDVANPATFAFERTSPFTLSAWIYRTATTAENEIVAKITSGGNFPGYALWAPANGQANSCNTTACTTNCLQMTLNSAIGANTACILVNGSAATPNAWHHVVATYSGSSTAAGINIYIDGVLRTPSYSYSNLTSSILVAADLKIGTDAPGQGDSFDGKIDDVRVYNRELSAKEVWQLYLGTP